MATTQDKDKLPLPGSCTLILQTVNTDQDVLVLHLDPKVVTGTA